MKWWEWLLISIAVLMVTEVIVAKTRNKKGPLWKTVRVIAKIINTVAFFLPENHVRW